MADLSVSGRIYRNGKLVPGILHIDEATGTIDMVARTSKAREHIDFGDKVILPGAIDVHVHFREPGSTHKEDWNTGTTSAAFGGVTGVVDMPNTAPPTITRTALAEKLRLASEGAVVDYAVWCGAAWFLDDLPEMLPQAAGLKIYLGATTGDLLMEDDERVLKALEHAGKAGKPVILHCEAERVLKQLRRQEMGLEDHDITRPPVAEVESIYDVMKMLPKIGKPPRIHIAHIASAEAVHAAEAAGFSRGVCPHHLILDTSVHPTMPTYGKMNPPLRSAAARDALWDAFAGGQIPIIESDHAPHTKVEKGEAFHSAPAGVPGVETMLPLLLARVAAGDVELATVVDAATKAPAELLGLTDRGALEKGMRADFTVWDLDDVKDLEASDLHSKCGWTPFEGQPVVLPSHTYLAGKPVVAERKLVAEPGTGRNMFEA